jgi:sec-independent protein translocase protein TatA
MFGKTEDLVVVLVIILVLFGAKKLPELSKGIAESVREVRKGFKDEPSARPSGESQPPRRVG